MKHHGKRSWLLLTLALSLLGANSGTALAAPVDRGQKSFTAVCAMCHGDDGAGRDQLGLNLRTSSYVKHSTDDQLVQFLKVGREGRKRLARRSDGTLVEETCGFDMPPKGGANYLTDKDLTDVVSYLRSINH